MKGLKRGSIVGNKRGSSVLSGIAAVFAACGGLYLLFAYFAGIDDILSTRELLILGASVLAIFILTFILSRETPSRELLLTLICGVTAGLALNFAFPELLKLPIQLPARNQITVTELDEGASVSMTWAYWFRPRSHDGNLFLTNPDRDISFSQLNRNGFSETLDDSEESILTASSADTSIGVPQRFRTRLAVLCIKVENGTALLEISGQSDPIRISSEMTTNQPYRIVLQNGWLSDRSGNLIQILLWGGAGFLLILCGMHFCEWIRSYQGKHRNALIYALAFLVPCLIMTLLCISLKITPFGEKSFLINDMWGEYADYMAYFRTILNGENDLLYSFSKSLGDDLPSLLAFYVINPLNWLVCLFPPERLPLAITILVILRFGICGQTASVYFVKRRRCGYSALLFSTCYALMSFNFINAENTNLREGTLILPLVILGLERLLDGGSVQCYIWSLAAVIFLNFYSGYQVCIFAALYFLFWVLLRKPEQPFKKLLRFLWASLLAVGISAFLLIPVACQLRNGPKTFDPSIFGLTLNMPWSGLFGKLLIGAYDVEQAATGYPNLYIGLLSILLIPLYFLNRKIPARTRLFTAGLAATFVLIVQLNPLNLILHGFNEPLWWPYRYSFVICFFMLMLAQESLSRLDITVSAYALTVLLAALLIGLLIRVGYSWMSHDSLKLNAVMAAIFIVILAISIRKAYPHTAGIMAALTVLELFLNGSHILSINTAYERSNTVSDYSAYYEENQSIIDRIREEDDGFYRIEKTYSRTPNDPMLLNYNGVSHYSSTLSSRVMDLTQRLGFRIYPPYRVLYWEGSDTAADSLLGIKYLVSGKSIAKPYIPVFSEGSHTVFENPYTLPLAFTASQEVLSTDMGNSISGFEYQNRIFSALTGTEIQIYRQASVDEPSTVNLTWSEESGEICYFVSNEDEAGELTWQIHADSDDTLYAFFPTDQVHPVHLTLNGRAAGAYFDSFSYHIQRLGSFHSGDNLSFTMIPDEESFCMKDAQFYYEDLSELEKAVELLTRDETVLEKLSSSHLTGSYTTAAPDKALFFTIPYDRGWTVKIDGQKVPVMEALGTFMAVAAPEGEHSLELRYVPVGLIPGIIITFFSAAASLWIGRKESSLWAKKSKGPRG